MLPYSGNMKASQGSDMDDMEWSCFDVQFTRKGYDRIFFAFRADECFILYIAGA
jgi:hypothetical protein